MFPMKSWIKSVIYVFPFVYRAGPGIIWLPRYLRPGHVQSAHSDSLTDCWPAGSETRREFETETNW